MALYQRQLPWARLRYSIVAGDSSEAGVYQEFGESSMPGEGRVENRESSVVRGEGVELIE